MARVWARAATGADVYRLDGIGALQNQRARRTKAIGNWPWSLWSGPPRMQAGANPLVPVRGNGFMIETVAEARWSCQDERRAIQKHPNARDSGCPGKVLTEGSIVPILVHC